jgi:hypothetical protein
MLRCSAVLFVLHVCIISDKKFVSYRRCITVGITDKMIERLNWPLKERMNEHRNRDQLSEPPFLCAASVLQWSNSLHFWATSGPVLPWASLSYAATSSLRLFCDLCWRPLSYFSGPPLLWATSLSQIVTSLSHVVSELLLLLWVKWMIGRNVHSSKTKWINWMSES